MNKVLKLLKEPSGFTLVELIITSVIIVIMVTVVGQIYIMGMVQSKTDMAKAKLQIEGKSAMEGIINNTKLASGIEQIHSGDTSGAQVLILKVPAITVDEEFLYNPPGGSTKDVDYITYYLENNNLHKKVESTNTSSRLNAQNGADNIILSSVKSLAFTYTPEIPNASKVAISLVLENTNYKTPIEVPLVGEGAIRNE